jgi:branched-chain amino acid transport system permease protein
MIVVGGLGSILGAVFGAIFISLLPVALSFLKDALPPAFGQQAGLEPGLFGLIIVLFIVFEPLGINGRWQKLRFFFETFPYYRKSSFVRQKSYLKTERMR